jgi:hypothetical protein
MATKTQTEELDPVLVAAVQETMRVQACEREVAAVLTKYNCQLAVENTVKIQPQK